MIDPTTLEAYVACRLIPLDKSPGVRPIGVGEVLRRIVGKCVGWVVKDDVQQAAGPLQTATGLQSGAEAAIHSMREMFESEETDAVILIDASNAFNSLNRQAALHNVRIICPQISTILINTYRTPARLIILGSHDIFSMEGTTQGDNLAMAFYALATAPLITILQLMSPDVGQVSLADDISGASVLISLKKWWDNVIIEGEKYGYFVNESKSWIIIKDPAKLQEAQRIFSDSAIKFTTDGKRHLGAAIGTDDFRAQYVGEKVEKWCNELIRLADFAKTQPQAAFAAFTHGILSKYTYFMRTIPGMEEFVKPLDEVIHQQLLPSILNCIVTEADRQMYSLPIRQGGLGIPILTEIAESQFEASKSITLPLVTIMIAQDNTLPDKNEVNEIKREVQQKKDKTTLEKALKVEKDQPPNTLKALQDAKMPGASSWLNVLPLAEFGFTLNKGEFRDSVS